MIKINPDWTEISCEIIVDGTLSFAEVKRTINPKKAVARYLYQGSFHMAIMTVKYVEQQLEKGEPLYV